MTYPSLTTYDSTCKACNGSGVQTNIYTGVKVRCLACDGSGDWNLPQRTVTICKSNLYGGRNSALGIIE